VAGASNGGVIGINATEGGGEVKRGIKEGGSDGGGGKGSGGIRGGAGRRGERREVVAARPSSGGLKVRDDWWGPPVSRA
jgi:hypothetical protein